MIDTDFQLAELLPLLERVDRVAVDTEADSLHCYYEKLCLVQLSLSGNDYLIDPLADFDLAPLAPQFEFCRDQNFRHGDRGAPTWHSRIQSRRVGREILRDCFDQGFAKSQ